MTEKVIKVQSPQDFTQINESIYGEESGHVKDFVLGALVGGIVGAAAALLLAPKAGSELRNDVAVQAVTFSGTAKEKTTQISNQLKEQSATLVEKVKAKTAKQPPAFDDGTVSSEGEEPLEEIVVDAAKDVDVEELVDDFVNSTRHSSIE